MTKEITHTEKGKYHPTCHAVSLTVAAKFVAFFDMAFGLFGLVWFVLMLSRYNIISLDPFENFDPSDSNDSTIQTIDTQGHHHQQEFSVNHKVISLSLVGFYTTVNLTVFVLLLVGIYKRSPGICFVWFHIRCAIFVFKFIILIMYVIGGRPLFSHFPFILSMLAHLYGLWVVNCYAEELKSKRYEEKIREIKEKQAEAARENCENYDIPNGIEAVQRKRLEDAILQRYQDNEKLDF